MDVFAVARVIATSRAHVADPSKDENEDWLEGYHDATAEVAIAVADLFENEYGDFDRDAFLTACGFDAD